jgi:hypothetical protein
MRALLVAAIRAISGYIQFLDLYPNNYASTMSKKEREKTF